jgi:metal-sulfur cluster biosynthetic enzyme
MPEMTETTVRAALRGVLDPELGINIVDLGLVLAIQIDDERIHVSLGVTSPTCPLGPHLCESARAAIAAQAPDMRVEVEITFDPPWTPELMSDAARTQLGW